jgi:hypothetical protein
MPDPVSVIDSSSILQVRRAVVREDQVGVFRKLTEIVQRDQLVFPKEVLAELERWSNPNPDSPDLPLKWALSNSPRATQNEVPFDMLRDVISRVSDIFDPDKSGVDEADPYVLALAIYLQSQGLSVTVLTEERKDRPNKVSMNTACGELGLVCLPMERFLRINGIWRRDL